MSAMFLAGRRGFCACRQTGDNAAMPCISRLMPAVISAAIRHALAGRMPVRLRSLLQAVHNEYLSFLTVARPEGDVLSGGLEVSCQTLCGVR